MLPYLDSVKRTMVNMKHVIKISGSQSLWCVRGGSASGGAGFVGIGRSCWTILVCVFFFKKKRARKRRKKSLLLGHCASIYRWWCVVLARWRTKNMGFWCKYLHLHHIAAFCTHATLHLRIIHSNQDSWFSGSCTLFECSWKRSKSRYISVNQHADKLNWHSESARSLKRKMILDDSIFLFGPR